MWYGQRKETTVFEYVYYSYLYTVSDKKPQPKPKQPLPKKKNNKTKTNLINKALQKINTQYFEKKILILTYSLTKCIWSWTEQNSIIAKKKKVAKKTYWNSFLQRAKNPFWITIPFPVFKGSALNEKNLIQ